MIRPCSICIFVLMSVAVATDVVTESFTKPENTISTETDYDSTTITTLSSTTTSTSTSTSAETRTEERVRGTKHDTGVVLNSEGKDTWRTWRAE